MKYHAQVTMLLSAYPVVYDGTEAEYMSPSYWVQGNETATIRGLKPMQKRYDEGPRFAVCLNNTEYPASLELHKIYRVIPDEEVALDGDIRVIDESGEDSLYPADFFAVIELPSAVEQAILQAS